VCTLIALSAVNPDVPLVVAANRDEIYTRAWAPPARVADSPRIVAGRDLTQNGTWLGVTEGGFFVGVTNQRTYGAADPAKRSRGQLVLDALEAGSVDLALVRLARVDAREYNPFNLLLGDARCLYVVYARGEASVTVERLPPGIWVLNNDTIGSRDFPKANRARDLVAPFAKEAWTTLAPKLAAALGDHQLPPLGDVPEPPAEALFSRETLRALQAVCVHTPAYGTSSATLLAIDRGKVRDYRFAEGPPCVTPFATVTELGR
jgi:uncharacterized protein with NRDE domain